MSEIRFSVVIPSFNAERYIAAALDSLLDQNYEDIELIVMDGGSRDGTLKILEGYRDQINILMSEPDEGQSDALNKGFGRASGDFFFWLNSDDLLVPGFLNRAGDYLSQHPDCKWLTFNTIFIDSDTKINFFYKGPSWNKFCVNGKGPQVDCPTSIFHRDLFLNSDGFDLRLNFAMDIDLWYQFLGMEHRWHRLNQYGYAFRMHKGSKTGNEGYGAPSSPEKNAQAALIAEKHHISTSWQADILVKLNKILFTKPPAWLDTHAWHGKLLCDYRPLWQVGS